MAVQAVAGVALLGGVLSVVPGLTSALVAFCAAVVVLTLPELAAGEPGEPTENVTGSIAEPVG